MMDLAQLEALIIEHFVHLVILPNKPFKPANEWLMANFGNDAASGEGDGWYFDEGKRWSECEDKEFPLMGCGFRFRDLDDAILFKLSCG